jgi:hypothetical protein
MRIKDFIEDIQEIVRGFIQNWGALIINFAVTLLGFWAAFSVFQVLAVNGLEHAAPVTKGHDTTWVKLLDAPTQGYATMEKNSTAPARQLAAQTDITSNDSINNPYFEGLKNNYIDRSYITTSPVNDEMIRKAVSAFQLSQHNYSWWVAALLAVFIFIGILYVFFYNLPHYSLEMRKDVDPEDLTKMFNKFSSNIELLGNPRKIKRLSNKIRFQYYYLENKGLVNTSNLEKLFSILLLFEDQNLLAPQESEKSRQLVQSQQSFSDFLTRNKIAPGTPEFMRVIFALNRDSFF